MNARINTALIRSPCCFSGVEGRGGVPVQVGREGGRTVPNIFLVSGSEKMKLLNPNITNSLCIYSFLYITPFPKKKNQLSPTKSST
jgi:hypothetical protein